MGGFCAGSQGLLLDFVQSRSFLPSRFSTGLGESGLRRDEEGCRFAGTAHAQEFSPLSKSRFVFALTISLFALPAAFSQGTFSLPAWLENYPGAEVTVQADDSSAVAIYTVDAQPAEVVAHYRKLFEAQGLAFQPNPDGMGTSIRAAPKECDLLILVRSRADGTYAKVSCTARVDAVAAPPAGKIEILKGDSRAQAQSAWQEKIRQHEEQYPPEKFNKDKHDMPAPPLVWPDWLTQIRGAALQPRRGVDPAHYAYMKEQYTTNVPMTDLFDFYRNLLTAHGYRPRAKLQTGHTFTGVQQNALADVEGYNYPDGFPGAYTLIEVSCDRTVLNGPITVSMRFSTHDYSVKRGY